MKIDNLFSIHDGEKILKSNQLIWDEIQYVINESNLTFFKGCSPEIKKKISISFNKLGWADTVKIKPTNLSINYIKRKVGVCFQLGNVARTYADLLKIQVFFQKKLIDVGVLIVPLKNYSKKIGSNIAQFERLREEIILFDQIITLPLVIIGLST